MVIRLQINLMYDLLWCSVECTYIINYHSADVSVWIYM